jgi:amino-acid N-acetyltransferase
MTKREASLRAATRADRRAVEHLLRALNLPTAGVAEWIEHFWIADHGGQTIGVVGIEQYGDAALLRSVAVDACWRDSGLGQALVEAALATARAAGVRSVYLLTTTAERYFPRFGFERIAREDVPHSLQASVEFQDACPASAVVMRKIVSTN